MTARRELLANLTFVDFLDFARFSGFFRVLKKKIQRNLEKSISENFQKMTLFFFYILTYKITKKKIKTGLIFFFYLFSVKTSLFSLRLFNFNSIRKKWTGLIFHVVCSSWNKICLTDKVEKKKKRPVLLFLCSYFLWIDLNLVHSKK